MRGVETGRSGEVAAMHCPNCSNRMREREQQGVTLDWCATCSSIWFDTAEVEAFRRASASGEPVHEDRGLSFHQSPGEQTLT